MRSITIIVFLLANFALSAQQTDPARIRKKAIYVQGLILDNPSVDLDAIGLIALNYEQSIFNFPGKHSRLAIAAGLTPPFIEEVDLAFHLGPKVYLGGPVKWFTMNLQYWGILNRTYYYTRTGTEPFTSYTQGAFLGTGYCFTGEKGFYFNPEFVLAAYTDNRRRDVFGEPPPGRIQMGLNLNIGFCF